MTATRTTVGFIGLGSQGGPMARRIVQAGFPLILWARRPDRLAPYADTAAEIAPTIADLGARCDHVGICVVDDAGVRDVCAALFPAMRPGSIIAIHATILPETCVALAEQAASRGLHLIDAPVSGGGQAATAGTLTVMVGGGAASLAQARPVFETFAGLITHLGGIGAGQNAKLVNNALLAATMGLADAALAAGTRLGIDGAALIDLIRQSSGRSYGFELRAKLPEPSAFAHGGMLLSKDIGLIGAVLGNDPSFAILRNAAMPFLDQVTQAKSQGG